MPVTLLETGDQAPRGWLVRLMGRTLLRSRKSDGLRTSELHSFTGDPQTRWIYNLALGGLSNNWTGAVPRFAPEDFTDGERLDGRYLWPITYDDLVPYYQQVERLLRISGSQHDVNSLPAGEVAYRRRLPDDWRAVSRHAESRGQGLVPLPIADGPPWMIANRSTAFNSFSVLVKPLLNSKLFRFIPRAHVIQLEWSGKAKRATAVLYYDKGRGSVKRLQAAAVVIACGPLHSTKLLFDSANADFPNGLGNVEGVLGRYLHDHPREWFAVDFSRPLALLGHAAYLTRKPPATSAPLLANSWTIGVASMRDKLASFAPTKGKTVGVQVFGTMIPGELYRVESNPDKYDQHGLHPLRIHIEFTPEVIRNMHQAREHFLALLSDAGYVGTLRDIVPQLYPGSSFHYGGTIRMHASPRYGMLDAWNRLHAVSNVFVVDASSFTTSPEKNPTLTAMALAGRAMDRLCTDLRQG